WDGGRLRSGRLVRVLGADNRKPSWRGVCGPACLARSRALLLAALIKRIAGIWLLDHLAVMRAQLDFAPRAQADERSGGRLAFGAIFQDDIAFRIDRQALDSRLPVLLLIEPGSRLLRLDMHAAVLDHDLALEIGRAH